MADTNNTNKNKKQSNLPNLKKKGKFNFYWIYAIMFFIIFVVYVSGFNDGTKKTDWPQLKEMLVDDDVEKIIVVNKDKAEIFIKEDKLKTDPKYEDVQPSGLSSGGPQYYYNISSAESFEAKLAEAQAEMKTPIYPEFENRTSWMDSLSWLLPIVILVVVWIVIMRMMGRGAGGGGGQIFNIGKSKAQLFDKSTSVTINFKDVAGLEEAKVEIKEIVDFLKNPEKYTKLGGKIPKGALLVGPPGTGKTLLAKAVAGEAKVPFFSISGSDFVEMFVGVGASRVRDLFKQAKEKAPCIIFIDEIDAIGRARGKNPMTGANDERENTLNQLLTEMDGFSSNTGVIILAATNRADILDRALMRAGRFDRQIHVELPDLIEREAIFNVHLRPLKADDSVNVKFLAKQTPGFSGADIANVCNESALIAARKGHESVTRQDFLDAIDRIIGGLEKRNKIITAKEKKVIAFHEAGHASISWLLEHAHPLVKVTIVPRGKALGAAWYLPEERQITTWEQMYDEMTATLGGRASEKVIFGKVSTGALNDLERVTKQAYNMVVFFGLNDKIGNISYYDSSGQSEYAFQKPYSEKTAELIDIEIKNLVEDAYQRAVKLLQENRDSLEKLAHRLLDKEVIFSEDLEEIFGPRPWDEEKRPGENGNGNGNGEKTEDSSQKSEVSSQKSEVRRQRTASRTQSPEPRTQEIIMDETTSREKVLKSIRNALMSKLDNPYKDVDFEASVFHKLDDTPEMVFARELIKVDGKFVYCGDDIEFAEVLKSVMAEKKWTSVHCIDEQLINILKQTDVNYTSDNEGFNNMKAGLTRCEYLVARLGSVMISSAQTSGRRMNVFPETHLVYARASQLIPDLKAALKGIKEKYGKELPSMISLITGPSRTADIEKTLVMGAHGPRELYVFMVDDQVYMK